MHGAQVGWLPSSTSSIPLPQSALVMGGSLVVSLIGFSISAGGPASKPADRGGCDVLRPNSATEINGRTACHLLHSFHWKIKSSNKAVDLYYLASLCIRFSTLSNRRNIFKYISQCSEYSHELQVNSVFVLSPPDNGKCVKGCFLGSQAKPHLGI